MERNFSIEVDVAANLGTVRCLLSSGTINENDIKNELKTHFLFSVVSRRTLGFPGTSVVNYAEFVSKDKILTMAARISEGRDSLVVPLLLGVQSLDQNYSILLVPDDVKGVAYRTEPKG